MGRLRDFAEETVIYGFANVFSRVFAMFLIPLYTNFLGKIDYSNLIMLQSLFTVLTFLLALNSGVFYYYYEYEKERYRKMVFTSWFYYQLFIASFLLAVLAFSSHQLKNIFILNEENEMIISLALILIGIQLFPYIINITNINLYRINRNPKSVMTITFLESFFTLIFIAGGLLFLNFGIVEIFASQIAARLLVALIYLKKASFFLKIKYFSMKLLRKLLSFSWPFFVISSFSWTILSIDKFIGAELLSDKEDVAILALAMQLTIPIVILADMIRMAIGPFVMSIRKEKDANQSYQQVFDLSIFTSSVLLVALIIITPLAVLILANASFMKVLNVVPLIALASVLSLIYNQLAIPFSLSKKNIYILYATVIGGLVGFTINRLFMQDYGFVVSGISQIMAYGVMGVMLFLLGKKFTDSDLNLKSVFPVLLIILGFFIVLYMNMIKILAGQYILLVPIGGITIISIIALFLYQQKISFTGIWRRMRG